MMEGRDGKGICPSCSGKIVPLIECDSCEVRTLREGLKPVQRTENCPICENPAKVVFECEECLKIYSFEDVISEKEGEHGCPMCGTVVIPDAESCPSCGFSFKVEEEEYVERVERLRKKRRVVGDYEEDDVREIMRIPGVGRLRAEVLCKAGYTSLDKLNRASAEDLARVRQIGRRTAKSIKEALQLMYVEPVESQRLLEESVEEEFECPVCSTIVSAYDGECMECGAAFERVVQDEGFIEEIEKVGEDRSSLSLFDMKLLENPENPQLWIARGALLRKMENFEEALRSYERAIEIKPGLRSAWIAKAEILSRLGKYDEAASCYREIVDDSATAAGIELGGKEEAMAALEELIAEDCPSCGSTIPPGSDICPSCGTELYKEDEEPPLEEDVVTEEVLEEELSLETLERELREEEMARAPPRVVKGRGLTNGRGRVNGAWLTKGRGRTNGLINGRGLTNGKEMVNGRGMTNGRETVNGKGRVNGLINGNGFTNGLSLSRIAIGPKRRAWQHYIVLGVAFAVLAMIVYGIVPETEKQVSPITIDGQFQDWEGAELYTDQGWGPNPDTSITEYGFRIDDRHFSFLVGVQGVALRDPSGYDSFYLFIDGDDNPYSGYIVRDIGADFMIEVFGGAGEVAKVPIYEYSNSQDRLNFTQWHQIASGRASVDENRLEGQFILNSRLDLSEDFRILFYADDYEGGATYSSVKIGPAYGALLISQSEYSPNAVLGTGSSDVLRLQLEAKGTDVHVDMVSFDVIGAQAQSLINVDVVAGATVVMDVDVDTSQSTNGELISISVADVVSDVPYTIRGSGAKAYFMNSPAYATIDGWFGEWEQQTELDSDGNPVVNPNTNIGESGVTKNGTDESAYFYLEVEDELLGGFSSPQVRHKVASSGEGPGEQTPPVIPLNRMVGEDRTYVYIDSNTSDDTVGTLVQGIDLKPDYVIRITGIYGEVTRREICQWSPGWNCTYAVQVEKDTSRMEISARIPGISTSEMDAVFASTDWKYRGDTTDPTTREVSSRGQIGPESMQPSWPSEWISVVTDNDEGLEDLSLEILEIYFNTDDDYLYVRIRTEADSAPTLTENTWWIYIDTNGDDNNDWLVVEMSGSDGGEVHGLAWNSDQWGGSESDWYDTLTDADEDSAARATIMTIGASTYGCVDFAVSNSEVTITEDTKIMAADNSTEDHNMTGNGDQSPPGQGLPYEYEDITNAGQIPEFEFALIPLMLTVIFRTVMIKRRKRYSGS